jgi:hypothetical protein
VAATTVADSRCPTPGFWSPCGKTKRSGIRGACRSNSFEATDSDVLANLASPAEASTRVCGMNQGSNVAGDR